MDCIKIYSSTSPDYKRYKKEPFIITPLNVDYSDIDDTIDDTNLDNQNLKNQNIPIVFTFSDKHIRLSKIGQLGRSRRNSNR